MQVVSLLSLIEATQDETETFLHKNAIPNEKRALTRTSLVVDARKL